MRRAGACLGVRICVAARRLRRRHRLGRRLDARRTSTTSDDASRAEQAVRGVARAASLPERGRGRARDRRRAAGLAEQQRRRRASQAPRARCSRDYSAVGATEGFARLCRGEIDIVDSARAISRAELAVCNANGLEIRTPIQIASDAIVLATRNESDVGGDCLTVARRARDLPPRLDDRQLEPARLRRPPAEGGRPRPGRQRVLELRLAGARRAERRDARRPARRLPRAPVRRRDPPDIIGAERDRARAGRSSRRSCASARTLAAPAPALRRQRGRRRRASACCATSAPRTAGARGARRRSQIPPRWRAATCGASNRAKRAAARSRAQDVRPALRRVARHPHARAARPGAPQRRRRLRALQLLRGLRGPAAPARDRRRGRARRGDRRRRQAHARRGADAAAAACRRSTRTATGSRTASSRRS